ncbi:phage tail tip lysozyme [Lactococcus lactis]|uniref:phage tail tip lysozyme n=1 Tax=Lactococcus lactis TaxID=1358 RepID=UPI0015C36704|nr:phage tail tip lysozyme [Lactococcus lactis]QLF89390.1 CHAP domain-containing protein [Lactococcus lactis subsp. lactis]
MRTKKGKEKAPQSSNSYRPTKQQQAQLKAAFDKSQSSLSKSEGKTKEKGFSERVKKKNIEAKRSKKSVAKKATPYMAQKALKKSLTENEETEEAVNRYEKARMPDRGLKLSKKFYDKVVAPQSKMGRINQAEKGAKVTKNAEAMMKTRQIKQRSQGSRAAAKVGRHLISLVKWTVSAISSIPFIFPILGIFAAIIIIISVFTSLIPVKQSEFELTKSWTAITQRDAQHNTDSVTYYTDIDQIMRYMNFKFDAYHVDKEMPKLNSEGNLNFPDASINAENRGTYKDFLNNLWDDMNDSGNATSYSDFQTINDLLKMDKTPYYLTKEEQENYKTISDSGFPEYALFEKILNPLVAPSDKDQDESNDPAVKVVQRYGYDKEGTQFKGIIIQAEQQPVYAPIDGKYSSNGTTVTLTSEDKKLTISSLTRLWAKDGQTIKAGQQIGISYAGDLTLKLQIRNPDDVKTTYIPKKDKAGNVLYDKNNNMIRVEKKTSQFNDVNPAFNLSSVEYLQATTINTDTNVPSTMVESATQIKNWIMKNVPGANLAGICGILGNWQGESGLQATAIQGGKAYDEATAMNSSVGGYAFALGQWDLGRRVALLNYAKAQKKDWKSSDLQLDYALNQDGTDSAVFMQVAMMSGSSAQATISFYQNWERPTFNAENLQLRQQYAQQWYNYFQNSGGETSDTIPTEYKSKVTPLPKKTDATKASPGNNYPASNGLGNGGNCTFYVYNRILERSGVSIYSYLGNGGDWATTGPQHGMKVDSEPKVGDIASFSPGTGGSSDAYGHVAVVEYVNTDGSYLLSESGYSNDKEPTIHWRVMSVTSGITFLNLGKK